ncbi:MAG: carbamoyltransferase HypF, partial [Candidatus Subteraquimicrobiales bacterium]|nr:carbamoyltransferase HypF [Candidatus Subteraquimicrobiales bacterium]
MTRYKILVKGIVQGVGFRPFIFRLAQIHQLNGWVLNSSEGVVIDVEGEKKHLDSFVKAIKKEKPPQAKIDEITLEKLFIPIGINSFEIKESLEGKEKFLLISPDIATCDECMKELFEPKDRRYRYPFINCTNCGPRFTIIEDIPYDRPKTTMKKFKMCDECQKEYDDPSNRRFHAQPNACPRCGPSLQLVGSQESGVGSVIRCEDLIQETIKLLKKGGSVAIKGLGGFHLACDAENEKAVLELRKRKKRFEKPFAVMMADIDKIKYHCEIDRQEEELLLSSQRPIVLLRKLPDSTIDEAVSPNNNYLGVMLPYTPLHHLLLKESDMVLVMTSGNISEEPIAMENEEAFRRLKAIADYFLIHNRDIYSRYDDSVVRSFNDTTSVIRRARSYAPYPVYLPFKAQEILAVGPELKNTFCLTKENYAFISQHIGDMENLETLEHFETTLKLYKKLFRIEPKFIAYDLHPEYLSTKFAFSQKDTLLIGVQHHHAHIVSCMVENEVQERVIGVSYDGTGYGTDDTIWGGEILLADWEDFERAAHLRYIPMAGGEKAIKRPYRMAFSYLYSLFGEDVKRLKIDFVKSLNNEEIEAMRNQLEKRINSPLTSSCGRLFDAVSALLGIRSVIDYEGQAAIELEMIADENIKESYPFEIHSEGNEAMVIDTEPIIRGIIKDLGKGALPSLISAKFHNSVVNFTVKICEKLREREGLNKVALSGGVFQNVYLLTRLNRKLKEHGFEVLTHKKVPTNDGGISLGQ